MRVALTSGRTEGLLAAWAHASAIGFYAALSLLFFTSAQALGGPWFWTLTVAGQSWLLYLGITMLRASRRPSVDSDNATADVAGRWYQGLLIGLFNPKIWLFFTAIFSPFAGRNDLSWTLAVLPFAVDGLWYTLIVLGVTRGTLAAWLHRVRRPMDAILGGLLCTLAVIALTDSVPSLFALWRDFL